MSAKQKELAGWEEDMTSRAQQFFPYCGCLLERCMVVNVIPQHLEVFTLVGQPAQ